MDKSWSVKNRRRRKIITWCIRIQQWYNIRHQPPNWFTAVPIMLCFDKCGPSNKMRFNEYWFSILKNQHQDSISWDLRYQQELLKWKTIIRDIGRTFSTKLVWCRLEKIHKRLECLEEWSDQRCQLQWIMMHIPLYLPLWLGSRYQERRLSIPWL